MGIPALDVAMSKQPVAILLTPSNQIEFRKIKLIKSKFFVVDTWGIFEVDSTKAVRYDKQMIFFYDIRSAKPIDIKQLKELEHFAKKNTLLKIKRKDIRQSNWLLRKIKGGAKPSEALNQIKEAEEKERKEVSKEIDRINKRILDENEKLVREGNPPISLDPDEYSSYIIEALVRKGLVTKIEAADLKMQLIRGQITIDDFLGKLEDLKQVEIHEPTTLSAEKYLEDYHAYDPSKVMAYIKMSRGLGKEIEKLGSPQVKNMFPIMFFILGMIGTAVAVLILSDSSIIDSLPFG